MPTTKAQKTRHHSNLRPRHRHTKTYLQTYWPYLPLLTIVVLIITVLQPWHTGVKTGVMAYATNVSTGSLLNSTNQQRNKFDQKPLKLNKKLSTAAQAKANDMVSRNYWSHETPDGQPPWAFVSRAGYSYEKAGENLAYGFLTSQQVVAGWMNSSSHRANLLDNNYKEVGFGFANSSNYDSSGPVTVVVAMYGTPGTPTTARTDKQELAPENIQSSSQPLTSLGQSTNSAPQSISTLQTITNGLMPWLPYLVGAVIGAAIMYLLVKHTVGIKRAIKKGEKYMAKHPLFDITLVAFVVLCLLLGRGAGRIL